MSEFSSSLEVGGPPPALEWRQYKWRPRGAVGFSFSSWYLVEARVESDSLPVECVEFFRELAERHSWPLPESSGFSWSVRLHSRVVHVEGMSVSACPYCGAEVPRLEGASYCVECVVECGHCRAQCDPHYSVFVESTEDSNEAHYCEECVECCSWPRCDSPRHPGSSYCPSHLDETRECSECGDRVPTHLSNSVGTDGEHEVCNDCLALFEECGECGEYHYSRTLRDGVCRTCRTSDDYYESGGIHSYSYKPRPKFFARMGDSAPFFGLEIEVEAMHDDSSPARGAELARRHCGDLVYCKSDRSLEEGVEIVTHPMSLEFLQTSTDVCEMLESLGAEGFRAWKTTTCGLHVHVSRAAFESSSHAFLFTLFHYRNAVEVARFSGRTARALNDYARLTHHQGDGNDWPTLASKIRNQGNVSVERYTAVNLANASTLEVRIFRGTLHHDSLVGCVEFLHALWAFTATLSSRDVLEGRLSWDALLEWVRDDDSRAAFYSRFLITAARRFSRVSA